MLRVASCRAAFRGLGTSTATVDKFEWGNFWLLRIGFFALAGVANEAKARLFSLLRCETIAGTVLPDIALVAGHAVTTIIEVLTVYATDRTVKYPLSFLFFELFEFLFKLFLMGKTLALGNAFSIDCRIAFYTLRNSTLRVVFQLSQLLFVEDALGFPLSHSLLSGESA